MEAGHTATPWFVEKMDYKSSSFYIRGTDANGKRMAWAKGAVAHIPRSTVMPSKANAKFIVRACNAHDDLVRALKGLLIELEFSAAQTDSGNLYAEVGKDNIKKIRAALAAAGA